MYPKAHPVITARALKKEFSLNLLRFVYRANIDSDFYMNPTKGQHYSRVDIDKGLEFARKLENIIIEQFNLALSDKNNSRESLIHAGYLMGRLFHNFQDFYSHTNWINLTGPEVKIWNEDPEKPNVNNPEKLVRCHFTWISEFMDLGTKHLFKKPIAIKNNYYEKYIDGSKLTHYVMSKDEAGTIADIAFRKKYGTSGFELAIKDAEVHTLKKWKDLENKVKSLFGEENFTELMNLYKSTLFNKEDMKTGRKLFKRHFSG